MPVTTVTEATESVLKAFDVKTGDFVFVTPGRFDHNSPILETKGVSVTYPPPYDSDGEVLENLWCLREVRKPTETEILEAKLLGQI